MEGTLVTINNFILNYPVKFTKEGERYFGQEMTQQESSEFSHVELSSLEDFKESYNQENRIPIQLVFKSKDGDISKQNYLARANIDLVYKALPIEIVLEELKRIEKEWK